MINKMLNMIIDRSICEYNKIIKISMYMYIFMVSICTKYIKYIYIYIYNL